MFKKSVAVRENVKLKIGLSGPSGSGKTYSALQLAYGITGDWGKIAVADTENKSALYYAEMGPWQHIPFDPSEVENGYHPRNWVKLIDYAAQDRSTQVLILDSISHEWEGVGGCLQLVDKINKGFAGWKAVTPLHNDFLDAMRLSPLHIIACMRSKQDYVVEQNDKGKATPRKVGLKSIQREGADYEFGLVFDIGMNHFATSSKDRTGLFMPRGEFQITPGVGKELATWSTSGAEPPGDPFANTEYDSSDDRLKLVLCERLIKAGIRKGDWGTISGLMLHKAMSQLPDVIKSWRGGAQGDPEA